jgi:hypothetical protein
MNIQIKKLNANLFNIKMKRKILNGLKFKVLRNEISVQIRRVLFIMHLKKYYQERCQEYIKSGNENDDL